MPGPVATMLLLLGLALLGFYGARYLPELESLWPVLAAAMLIVFFAPMLFRGSPKSIGETYAEITGESLRLPRGMGSAIIDELRLADIEALLLRGDDRHGIIYIGTRRSNYVLQVNAFLDPNGARAFYEELRNRIRVRRGGVQHLAEIEQRDADSVKALDVKCIVNQLILALLAVVFFVQKAANALDSNFALIRFGANSRILVADGQWYRLFSANFLHGHEVHLVMNSIAIFSLGFAVERLIGRTRFLLVFLLSALAGAMASLLSAKMLISVGASTAVCGLLGSFAFLQLRYPQKMPAGFHQPPRTWAWIFALNIALPLFFPEIDSLAHLGGLVAGVLITFLVTSHEDRFPLPPAPRGNIVAVALLAVVFFAALGIAAEKIRTPDKVDGLKLIEALAVTKSGPETLNNIAWLTAIKKNVSRIDLELAFIASERSVALEESLGGKALARDTLATLHHRLGDHDRAIALEVEVIQDPEMMIDPEQDKFCATQLARFIAARIDRGPLDLTGTSSAGRDLGSYYLARTDPDRKILGLIAVPRGETVKPEVPYSWPSNTMLELGLSAPLTTGARTWEADKLALDLP